MGAPRDNFYANISTSSGITTVLDPFQIYLSASKQYPLLSRREEQELGKELEQCYHGFFSSLCIYSEESTDRPKFDGPSIFPKRLLLKERFPLLYDNGLTTSLGFLYWEVKSLFDDGRIDEKTYQQFFEWGQNIDTCEFFTPEQCREHQKYNTLFELLHYKIPRSALRTAGTNLHKHMQKTNQSSGVERLLRLCVHHEKQLVNRLTCSNVRMVAKIALDYHRTHQTYIRGLDLLDLVQHGNLGLMRAIEKFEYRRGYRFASYAYRIISQEIQRGIMREARTVRLPGAFQRKYRTYMEARLKLEHELVRDPTLQELAEEMQMDVPALMKFLQMPSKQNPMEKPTGECGKVVADYIPDPQGSPEELTEQVRLADRFDTLFYERLTPKEEKVLRMRYGVGEESDHTLQEVGDHFSVTRQAINLVEKSAMRKLKEIVVSGKW